MTATAARDDINRIIIGLGGQGTRLVNAVRKEIQRLGPEPEGVAFMAIDSDRVSLAGLDAIPLENQVYLQAPDENITETMVPWLPAEFQPRAGGGCGMQRLTGKAMYLVHRQRVLEAVYSVARRLRERTQMGKFMIVIVNAFGGGTGSGMLIDFALDLRAGIADLVGQKPMIFGLGVLPSRGETIQRANGVALLKELHFLLAHKDPVVVNGRDLSNPFELYFVVGREIMGIEKDDEVTESVIRFTIDLGLIPATTLEANGNGKGAGWVDLQDIRTLIKGSSHMFATFGHYRAVFPDARLREYLRVVDELEAVKARIPALATEAEGAWKSVNEGKIALAVAERALQTAEARFKRLRAGGILAASRPELRRFQEEIVRLEDTLLRRRRDLAERETAIPAGEEERRRLQAELARLESRRDDLIAALASPAQSQNTYTVPVGREEVERIAANRRLLDEGTFAQVMEFLGRTREYHDKTLEVIGKNKILFMPMLTYRMAFHTAALFPPEVIRVLAQFGFVRFDASGNPVVTDDQLWMVMAMMSSHRDNVDLQKLSARAFKDLVENYVAKRAEVKTLHTRLKPFEVTTHSWMIGLQITPIAPGYPPRLRELERLLPEYEKLARERELIQHHAFLYGDPLAFAALTGLTPDVMDPQRMNERITTFWAEYVPIDAAARWLQVPPILAEALVALETVKSALHGLSREVDGFRLEPEPAPMVTGLDQMTANVRRAEEAFAAYERITSQGGQAIKDRLAALTAQVERAREGPRDPAHLARLQEMADTALMETAALRRRVDEMREHLDAVLASHVRAAEEKAAPLEHSDRLSVTLSARLRRAILDLEEERGRFAAATGALLVTLHGTEDVLMRLLGHLRASAATHAARVDGGRGGTVRVHVTFPKGSPANGGPHPEETDREDAITRILEKTEGSR